jgi:hypothetical protein
MNIRNLARVSVAAVALIAGAAQAAVLYDNGPANFTINAWTAAFGISDADSFVLGASANVTGFTFDTWLNLGDSVTSIDWAITTAPFGAAIASGTAAVGYSLTSAGIFGGSFDGGHNIVAIASVALTAGTYYLELGNGQTAQSLGVYWDINNGPSSAFQSGFGDLEDECGPGTCSNTFTITDGGKDGTVPEPASWALMVAGFGLVGGALRRRTVIAA